MMVKVEFNCQQDTQFKGLDNCLSLYNNAPVTEGLLNACWNEVKSNKDNIALFYSLCFMRGDITNREHNIFQKKKVDSGGSADRDAFRTFISWLFKYNKEQFKKFLFAGLFNEYSCFDLLIENRVKTQKNTAKVQSYRVMFNDEEYCDMLAEYFTSIINGNNPFNKMLIAKFLTVPRFGVRQNHKQMLPETKEVMTYRANFLAKLSDLNGWDYVWNGKGYARFDGFRKFKSLYNQELESVLFSTGRINEFDEEEFKTWLNKLPSGARFRVKNKVMYSEDGQKYSKLQKWFEEWEAYKEAKQSEQRILEEKIRQNLASEEDKTKLQQVKKEAKVTTAGTNFKTIYEGICYGNYDPLAIEDFIRNKVNLPYNNLVIIDDSGSMQGAPFRFAKFLAAVMLVKNPDDDGRNLVGMFNYNNNGRFYTTVYAKTRSRNSLVRGSATMIAPEPFVKPELSFMENYRRIDAFLESQFQSGGTDLSSIVRAISKAAKEDPTVFDYLKQFPVWTVVSDGDLGGVIASESYLKDFFSQCEELLGFRPFVIFIDVNKYRSQAITRWKEIDNVIHIVNDPNKIETVLTRFKDLQQFDIYTPLRSIFASNRYNPVKQNIIYE